MILRMTVLLTLVSVLGGRGFGGDRMPVFQLPGLPGASEFFVPSVSEIAGARQDVVGRLEAIEKLLAESPAGAGIRAQTRLDVLREKLNENEQLAADDARAVIERLGTGADYLENPAFLQLRQALVKYERTIAAIDAPAIAHLYYDRRAAMERGWESLRYGDDEQALERVRENYAWCVAHRQAEPELRVIKSNLDRGNVIMTLDHGHMAALIPSIPRQVVPMSFNQDGTTVRGSGFLDLTAGLGFVPNSGAGELQLIINGTMRGSMVANRVRISVDIQSSAQMASAANVVIEGSTMKLKQQPASRASSQAYATSATPPLNVPVVRRLTGRIIQNVVNRQLAENKPQMDSMIAAQMSQTMATEIAKQCQKINFTYDQAFFSPLRRHGISPEFKAATQRQALTMAYAFCDGDDVAGIPPATSGAQSHLVMHESLACGLERLFAGKSFDAASFCEQFFETIGFLPCEEAISTVPGSDPIVTLAQKQPLAASFRQGRMHLVVSIEKVDRGDQKTDYGPWQLAGDYVVASTSPALVLRRVGEVEISGSSASQGLLAEEAVQFLPVQLEFSDYTALGQLLRKASLVIGDVSLANGWAQLNFVEAKAAEGQAAGTLAKK